MNRGFREDENELPYLLWEKRDGISSKSNRGQSPNANRQTLDDVLNSLYISDGQRAVLRAKLVSFLNSGDNISLTVEDGFDGCMFIFTRENEYVKTTDQFEYCTSFNLKRVFSDCYSSHDYDKLLNNPRFKAMIKKTGLEFLRCNGGFVCEYSGRFDEFTMKNELDLCVIFKDGSTTRGYELDLDRMELGRKLF